VNDSVSESITVGVPQEKAFYAFAQQMTSWWPRRYTWSGSELNHIVLDPEVGARWYEVSESGKEEPDWGRLLAWEPPSRLALSWMINPKREPERDETHGSEVDVTFTPQGENSTRIDVEHRGFMNHGEGWQAYRDGMQSADGWKMILGDLALYLEHQEKQYDELDERRIAS
jgi:uncharacterized protein YndB with AHSA1/START domain